MTKIGLEDERCQTITQQTAGREDDRVVKKGWREKFNDEEERAADNWENAFADIDWIKRHRDAAQ